MGDMKCHAGKGLHPQSSGQFQGPPLPSRSPRLAGISLLLFSSERLWALGVGPVSALPLSAEPRGPLCTHGFPAPGSAQRTRPRRVGGRGRPGVRENKKTRAASAPKGWSRGVQGRRRAARLAERPRAPCRGARAAVPRLRAQPLPGRATTGPRHHREAPRS